MTGKALTTCLWFDTQGEEAAAFYTGVFPDSRMGRVTRNGEGGAGPEGSVLVVEFELNGQQFMVLNGGPQEFGFNHSISFQIPCADQAEVDYFWEKLTDGGQEVACGWVTDKFGLSWQVVPAVLTEMMNDPDPAKASRVTAAMLKMVKFDIAGLQRAFDGG